MNEQDSGALTPEAREKAGFWNGKILDWEAARYSPLARLNPFSWTVQRRMRAAGRLLREELLRYNNVLDLGCGSGLLAQAVLGDPGRRYTGVDFSKVAVEAARAHYTAYSGRVRFELRDVLDGTAWEAPLIVFLGLLDWLDERELDLLFGRLKAETLCFSFTEEKSGAGGLLYRQYRRFADGSYRARNFPAARIAAAAKAGGYRVDSMRAFSRLDPGRLVTASRT
jgi:SAM-dependent methyltransferase